MAVQIFTNYSGKIFAEKRSHKVHGAQYKDSKWSLGEFQFRRLEKMLSTLPTLWCTLLTTVSSTVWMLISTYRPSIDVKTFPMECRCIFVLILSEASLSLIWIFLFTAVLRIRIRIRIRRIRTYVFGPSGSRSGYISERYGSGSFYHQAKVVRKTLIPTVF